MVVVSCALCVVGCALWVVGCGLWVVRCGWWVVGGESERGEKRLIEIGED